MSDTVNEKPNHDCLFATASGQHGYFTSAQARDCGFSRSLLSHQTDAGRYLRIRRGLYRLRNYPEYPREEVVSAWLAAGKETSVVSHESALDLLQLSDVIPNYTHITVPRSRRNLPRLPGVKIHTTTRPFGPLDVVVRDGMRVTSASRTILDAAEAGTAPEQIEMAIRRALARAMVTREQLTEGASHRSLRVQNLITGLEPDIRSGHAAAARLLDPLLDGNASGTARWKPEVGAWE